MLRHINGNSFTRLLHSLVLFSLITRQACYLKMVVMPGHYGVLTSAVKNADKHFCIVLIGLTNKGIEYEITLRAEGILYCYIMRNPILNYACISLE